jgi:hypothetical protein
MPEDGAPAQPGETEAEKRLWAAALVGEVADVADLPDPSRRVRPAFIHSLLTREAARLTPRGLRLKGAWLDGQLDLARVGAALPHAPALELRDCRGEGEEGLFLNMTEAALVGLDLSGSHLAWLEAPGLRLAGGLQLERMRPGAILMLRRAVIEGGVTLTGLPDSEASGSLDLGGARIGGQVLLHGARLGWMSLRRATLGEELHLAAGTQLGGTGDDALQADGAQIRGAVFIGGPGTTVEGATRLLGAEIGGQLRICDGAVLRNAGNPALNADQARITGGVFLEGKGTTIEGETRLPGAEIGGQLTIRGSAVLRNAGKPALNADGARITGGVFVAGDGTTIEGETRLPAAEIGGALSIGDGAALRNAGNPALNADGARITGGVFVEGKGTTIEGATRLPGAEIGGSLGIHSGAVLRNPGGHGLAAAGARITGGVFVAGKGTTIEGETLLLDSQIVGPVAIGAGAVLRHPAGHALQASSATIRGGLSLRGDNPGDPGPVLDGRVVLAEARIGRAMDLRGARIALDGTAPGVALHAEGLHLDGDLRLGDGSADPRSFGPAHLDGPIRLDRARIEGALVLNGAVIAPGPIGGETEVALALEGARIGARIECHRLPPETRGILDLRGAHTAFLDDHGGRGWGDPCARDQPGRPDGQLSGVLLRLDGFTYDRLPELGEGGATLEDRLAFLHRQYPGPEPDPGHYAPQPFEQAAKVMRAQGYPEQAEIIAREKRRFRTRCRVDKPYVRALQRFLDRGFGHFYSPPRAIATLGLSIAAGMVLLLLADTAGALVKKRNEVDLVPAQIAAATAILHGAPQPVPPREACWAPPQQNQWLWAPLAVAETGLMALDLLLPLVDLKQEARCEVDWDKPVRGRAFGILLAVYSALGLVIVPLFVATVSGLAKRD